MRPSRILVWAALSAHLLFFSLACGGAHTPDPGTPPVVATPLASSSAPDRFEGDALSLHQARRQAFLEIAAREPERCAVVDASRPEDGVADEIWRVVSARLLHPPRQLATRAGG